MSHKHSWNTASSENKFNSDDESYISDIKYTSAEKETFLLYSSQKKIKYEENTVTGNTCSLMFSYLPCDTGTAGENKASTRAKVTQYVTQFTYF